VFLRRGEWHAARCVVRRGRPVRRGCGRGVAGAGSGRRGSGRGSGRG
jgi:hypothetical protein